MYSIIYDSESEDVNQEDGDQSFTELEREEFSKILASVTEPKKKWSVNFGFTVEK